MNWLSPKRGEKVVQFLGCIFAVLLICVPAFSQSSTGRILGTITDQSGGVIAGATVTVTDVDRGVTRTLTTDAAGEYNAPQLSPGTYKVRAEAKGFKSIERQNIALEVGREPRVDLTLQPGELGQTITITEQLPLVETTNATLGGVIDHEDINDMPLNGRNYQNLLSLRPGVQLYPGGGPWTQSTNGVRPDETAWQVDGVLNVNFWDARPVANVSSPFADGATILPLDAIQEFNLEISPKAEAGWKPGAVLNVGVKSGTNTLHGTAYAFGRTDSWDARNYFNPPATGTNCATGAVASCDKLPLELKQFGATAGGPIKKDKLFWFGGYEGQRLLVGNAFSTTGVATGPGSGPNSSLVDALHDVQAAGFPISPVSLNMAGCPTSVPALGSAHWTDGTYTCTGGLWQGAGANSDAYLITIPNTTSSNNGVGKIDAHLNDKQTLNGMLFTGYYDGVGIDHTVANNLAFANPVSIRTWTNTESWVWIPNSKIVNEVRFGYNRFTFLFLANDANKLADGSGLTGGSGYALNTGITNPIVGGLPTVNVGSFHSYATLGSWQSRPAYNTPNPYYNFQENLSYLTGKHALKFGGELLHIEADSINYNEGRGRIFFTSGNCFSNSTRLDDFFCGAVDHSHLLAGDGSRQMRWMSYAWYVQDDWHMTPKVTLNLGLRYEYKQPIKEVDGRWGNFDPTSKYGLVQQGKGGLDSIFRPDRTNFGPRIGFAWDLSGRGTTVVRAGASVMYSSYAAVYFMSQNGLSNTTSPGVHSDPTGGLVETGTCIVTGTCPTFVDGGNISLLSASYPASKTCWDPSIGGGACASQSTFFPSGTVQAACGDGSTATVGLVTKKNAGPCDLLAVDPHLRTPYIATYSFGIQHAFTTNLALEVGYVGNRGERLIGFRDINQVDPKTGAPGFPQFPWFGFINQASNDGHSKYNGLQATLTKRPSHGLSFVLGYTYAHGLDNGSLNRFGQTPQDSRHPEVEYASSDADIRHRLTFTTTYNIPGIKGFAQLLEGWQLNSIVTVQTGQPWTVIDTGTNVSGFGEGNDRWDFFGNPSDFVSGKNSIPFCNGPATPLDTHCYQTSLYGQINVPNQWAKCTAVAPDPGTLVADGCFVSGGSVMVPPKAGTPGTMGRNLFRDPGFRNWDFSIFKNFTFKERYGVQFRAEGFNILNHPNLANPFGSANGWATGIDPSSGAGLGYPQATADVAAGNTQLGSGAARALQLGLKLTF